MSTKTFLVALLVVFVGLCGFLVIESGLFEHAPFCPAPGCIMLTSDTSLTTAQPQQIKEENTDTGSDFDLSELTAVSGKRQAKTIGSIHPDTGDKFQITLTSEGAAISDVTLSEFDDRDPDEPKPLVLLSPLDTSSGGKVLTLANRYFGIEGQKKEFPLHKLNWQLIEEYSSQKATFSAFLKDAEAKDAIKLTKTFTITPDSYNLQCDLKIENFSYEQIKAKFDLQGPVGVLREGARGDMRNIITAFLTPKGVIESAKTDNNKLRKAKKTNNSEGLQLNHKDANTHFIWGSVTNKYFAAILRPVPEEGSLWLPELSLDQAQYYDPGLMDKKPDGDEHSTFGIKISPVILAAAGQAGSAKNFEFQLYLGPKDREIFQDDELYKKLAYFQTINFLGCCCPQAVINPMAFGIMATMKWMYGLVPNYGIVIIIFVIFVRILLHPVTKKSQVSMMKMQKLGPKMEEIKKKYANNKQEMNKHVMKMYKEQGVSPVSSMLPMMIQMPIWIALYSAIYANIALRGAAFLPFWITDLSAPDALVRFNEITIPLLNIPLDSFNLLPILLATAMFMQQKLMPHSSSAQVNPQVAQQQKMMLVMMPIMMLVFLFKAPSGLNLYIMASTFAGVAEQIVIRKHIRGREAEEAVGLVSATSKTGGKIKKKKPKPFFKNTM